MKLGRTCAAIGLAILAASGMYWGATGFERSRILSQSESAAPPETSPLAEETGSGSAERSGKHPDSIDAAPALDMAAPADAKTRTDPATDCGAKPADKA